MEIPLPYRPENGLEGLLGLEIVAFSRDEVRARVEVRDHLKQPFGLVHGGVYAAVAEALASMGTAWAVAPEGRIAMGLANQTSFLRPITQGTIHAVATAPPPRPHDLGVGRRDHRRRGPALRPHARDGGRAGGAARAERDPGLLTWDDRAISLGSGW